MLENLKLLSGTLAKMEYSAERQKLISNNIAHADTPKYTGKDLKPFSLSDEDDFVLKSTRPQHFASARMIGGAMYDADSKPADVYDQTLNKNKVSIEEEMVKAADAEASHHLARSVWQKSLSMLRMSLGGR